MSAHLIELAEALSAKAAQVRRARAQQRATTSLVKAVRVGFGLQRVAVLKALAGQRDRWPTASVEEARVLREASDDDLSAALWEAIDTSSEPLQDAIQTFSGQMFVTAARQTAAVQQFTLEGVWDLKHPAAVEYMNTSGAQAITAINQTTRDAIQRLVAEAVDDGWSYNQVARAIRDQFDGFSTPQPQQHIPDRATLVAVTEIGNAYEAGSRALIDEMAAVGFEMQKSWLTVEDERTSEACLGNAAAGWIAHDEAFPSGHQQPLEHPGCRCTCLHRRKPTPH